MKIVSIHQPNFFPWLGYFNKIVRADVFIILNNVQFPKTGGTWANRVKLIIGKGPDWLTVPIIRTYHGTQLIKDIQINHSTHWKDKMLKTIQTNYGRTPYYRQVFPIIEKLINNYGQNLAAANIHAIYTLAEHLGISKLKFILGTDLASESKSTDLLIDLVRSVGGTHYLCGGGASDYQQDEKFPNSNVQLTYQNFQHPTYLQHNHSNEFVPGLSIIDALMNFGFEKTMELIK